MDAPDARGRVTAPQTNLKRKAASAPTAPVTPPPEDENDYAEEVEAEEYEIEEPPEPAPKRSKGRLLDQKVSTVLKTRGNELEQYVQRIMEPPKKLRRAHAQALLNENGGELAEIETDLPYFSGALPDMEEKFAKKQEVDHTEVPLPSVPQPPFTWNVVGPSGQGKTTAVVRLLLGPYRERFDDVFFFVPSFYTDDQWARLKHPKEKVFLQWEPSDFSNILNYQRFLCHNERRGNTTAPNVLIVIDDSMGFQHSGSTITALDELYSYGRKLKISIMNLAQRYKQQLSTTVRRNATHTTIFDTFNQGEYLSVQDELRRPGVTRKQFEAMYKDATTKVEKGGALTISRLNNYGAPYSSFGEKGQTIYPIL